MKQNETAIYREQPDIKAAQFITVFDGSRPPFTVNLKNAESDRICFGRLQENDIVLESPLVSRRHGAFVRRNGKWFITDENSLNGLTFNDARIVERELAEGDLIRVDSNQQPYAEGVLFIIAFSSAEAQWQCMPLEGRRLTIGRSDACDIVLSHVCISRQHAVIEQKNGEWQILDKHSTNGIIINGMPIEGSAQLHEKDVIAIADARLIFTNHALYSCVFNKGFTVDAEDIVIKRGKGSKTKTTVNRVSLNIHPGELVAIIGGSGAGKSTLLNAMCGYLPPNEGGVWVNGIHLYHNFESLKLLIGYVPQSDIVFNNLTVEDMLRYAASLRLPKDTSKAEMDESISKALELVELNDKRTSVIRNLSGGQRKRTSIAVELLSDPGLMFMDEPASGLDPGTEQSLMLSLRRLADSGKTIVLVTHSTLQLKLCDRIVVMGNGGHLCFCGNYEETLAFFGVEDIIDVYHLIHSQAEMWERKYSEMRMQTDFKRAVTGTVPKRRNGGFSQALVLFARTFRLFMNDRHRMIMILAQAPILALLISMVAEKNVFAQNAYSETRSVLFMLSCCGFWVGMLNAVQEICKERSILLREYMAGLSVNAYIGAKFVFMSILCLIQSFLLIILFILLNHIPSRGILLPFAIEMCLTTFFTMLSATTMGLLVSALVRNADRAMAIAPLLLVPQILFAGIVFPLDGIKEILSWVVSCRWSMAAYGTTANLNAMFAGIYPMPILDSYLYTPEHQLCVWGILLGLSIVFLLMARLALLTLKKEE